MLTSTIFLTNALAFIWIKSVHTQIDLDSLLFYDSFLVVGKDDILSFFSVFLFFGPQLAIERIPPGPYFFGYLFETASSHRLLSGLSEAVIIYLVLGWLVAGSPDIFFPLSQVSIV